MKWADKADKVLKLLLKLSINVGLECINRVDIKRTFVQHVNFFQVK